MKRSDAFPSKYVSKDNVTTPVVWTISVVRLVEMDGDDGTKKQPPVAYFSNPESKPLIVNNSNWMTIEDLYGADSDDWVGKQIELYCDPNVMFGGKRVGGVRVRKPSGNTAPVNVHTATDELVTLRALLKSKRDALRATGTEPRALTREMVNAMNADQLAVEIAATVELMPK